MLRPRFLLSSLSALAMVAVLAVPASDAQAQRSSRSSHHSNAGHSSSYRGHSSHSSRHSSHSRSSFGVHVNFGRGHGSTCSPSYSTHHYQSRRYVPGYYKTVTTKVLVSAGHYDKVFHPAEYGTQFDAYGNACRVVVRPAHYDKVWHPAEYRYQTQRVWVPGCYR